MNLQMKECHKCGKQFIPGAQHLYKLTNKYKKTTYYCSYTCWRSEGGDNKRYYTK